MLSHLLIRNLAVVDEVEVEPGAGLTVLTGETGAGKSILIDALSLALGERADSEAVRHGAERAEVSAEFDIAADTPAADWLKAHDLDSGDSCLLRRVVTAEGRSRGYINGNPAPMQTLRALGELLVDICGQQAHQSLGKADTQRRILDQHGGLQKQANHVREAWQAWQTLRDEYAELDAARADQHARLELLSFQVEELLALDAQPGELAELDSAQRRAANASRLITGAGDALQALYENTETPPASDIVSKTAVLLNELSEADPVLGETARILQEAEIQITEAADNLRQYLAGDHDSDLDLQALEARLAAMHDLARKHRVDAAELPELTERLQQELDRIENADGTLAELETKVAAAAKHLATVSNKLSKARAKAAGELSATISSNIQQLGMPDGEFSIALTPLDTPGAHGAERVEFRVAVNAGLQAGPLNKVASGGELSRISLAIQVAASAGGRTPVMIFDEVDAGVGGGTADIVGSRLRELAGSAQVLCVTHLPQVASKGHGHFRVSKLSDGKTTRTRVAALSEEERTEEIARMLGGIDITERTREHAREMLEQAAKPQKTG
ncbi:MAG: DNA repair protein RecN [Gammaproteobacteria bacterium]|nr:DNA repair protein RecN [Gammaproteobacteria bacterium]NND53528.1 DNA repair protein RecN [Gammaproteobacteria bacterium]